MKQVIDDISLVPYGTRGTNKRTNDNIKTAFLMLFYYLVPFYYILGTWNKRNKRLIIHYTGVIRLISLVPSL